MINKEESVESRILEIVFYLIDLFRDNQGQPVDVNTASSELRDLGYSDEEIDEAYALVTHRSQFGGETLYSSFPLSSVSTRLLTSEERLRLSPDAQSFVLKISHIGLISSEQLEGILEVALNSGAGAVSVDEIKHITSGILMAERPEGEIAIHFDPDGSDRLH